MNTTDNQTETIEKFRELLGAFDDAMFVSSDAAGQPHARPMRVAKHDSQGRDELWFVTSLESGKVDEILREPRVAITFADGARFLSISGLARVVNDRSKIHELWSESWRLWFPDGPGSTDIGLIQVQPLRAEYWDTSFPNGARFALSAAKAWVKDEAIDPPEGPEHHAELRIA